jgi:hypothetical protein
LPNPSPCRLVVDENDAATDHGGDEDGGHDGAGEQILDVRDVRVTSTTDKETLPVRRGAIFLSL